MTYLPRQTAAPDPASIERKTRRPSAASPGPPALLRTPWRPWGLLFPQPPAPTVLEAGPIGAQSPWGAHSRAGDVRGREAASPLASPSASPSASPWPPPCTPPLAASAASRPSLSMVLKAPKGGSAPASSGQEVPGGSLQPPAASRRFRDFWLRFNPAPLWPPPGG